MAILKTYLKCYGFWAPVWSRLKTSQLYCTATIYAATKSGTRGGSLVNFDLYAVTWMISTVLVPRPSASSPILCCQSKVHRFLLALFYARLSFYEHL